MSNDQRSFLLNKDPLNEWADDKQTLTLNVFDTKCYFLCLRSGCLQDLVSNSTLCINYKDHLDCTYVKNREHVCTILKATFTGSYYVHYDKIRQ